VQGVLAALDGSSVKQRMKQQPMTESACAGWSIWFWVGSEAGTMTESEWNTATDPDAMLEFLGRSRFALSKSGCRLSARKFRLCAVAVCRRVWPMLADGRLRTAVETAEKYADGDVTDEELATVHSDADSTSAKLLAAAFTSRSREAGMQANAASAASSALRLFAFDAARCSTNFACLAASGNAIGENARSYDERLAQAQILRDIFDTPWRPVSAIEVPSQNFAIARLAADIYEERAFSRLPELAVALEEAGCRDAVLLGHLQGEGPQVKGCWALDTILGKE
jgi:hypothetical protein